MGGVFALPTAALDGLKRYKYVSGGYSPLDNVMNPYWEAVVKLLPMVGRFSFASLLLGGSLPSPPAPPVCPCSGWRLIWSR